MSKKDIIKLLKKSKQYGGESKILILPFISDKELLLDLQSSKKQLGYIISKEEMDIRKIKLKTELNKYVNEINITDIILNNLISPKIEVIDIKPLLNSTLEDTIYYEKEYLTLLHYNRNSDIYPELKYQKDLLLFTESILFDTILYLQLIYKEYVQTETIKQLKDIYKLKKKLFLDRHEIIRNIILNHDLLYKQTKFSKWLQNKKIEKFIGKHIKHEYPKIITDIMIKNMNTVKRLNQNSNFEFIFINLYNIYQKETNLIKVTELLRKKRSFYESKDDLIDINYFNDNDRIYEWYGSIFFPSNNYDEFVKPRGYDNNRAIQIYY